MSWNGFDVTVGDTVSDASKKTDSGATPVTRLAHSETFNPPVDAGLHEASTGAGVGVGVGVGVKTAAEVVDAVAAGASPPPPPPQPPKAMVTSSEPAKVQKRLEGYGVGI